MDTRPPSPPRHQDRRHARPGLQHAGAARADDPAQGQRGAAELQPRHGAGPHRPRRAWCARRRARTGREVAIMADLQGPKIRVGKFAEGKVWLEPGAKFVLDAARTEPGDIDGVGLDYKDLPRDVKAGDKLLLNDGLIVLTVDAVKGEHGAHHRQARRRAVQQQGHQQAGRRPHRAGADRQGHGRHQDRDELPGRLRGGELPEERDRHGNGAPALQRGRRPSTATSPA